MAGKEEAIKQKCGRWEFQSGVDDDSSLMGKDDTSFSSYVVSRETAGWFHL
jgi:hypothetical protein